MSKQQKTQKLELATLDAKNIQELDGWKEKQEAVIKENPFIKIEDRETYEIAKSRRTALVSARTEIQKQDKLIGSVVSNFRKQTMSIAKDLIAITEPHEEKQQHEFSVYEEILEEKRREKELEEERRVQKIQEKIELFKTLMNDHLNLMTFETIKQTKHLMDDEVISAREFNFEEFEPLFDEVLLDIQGRFDVMSGSLVDQEEKRIENLHRDQEAKINELIVRSTEMIDETGVENADTLKKSVDLLFSIEFDFGDYTKQFEEAKLKMDQKVESKLKSIEEEAERRKEIQKQEDINRINNVREGLLDKIFQMTADDHESDLKYIEDALTQDNPFPELQDRFDKMIQTVNQNLTAKMKMIESEIEQRKKEAEDARIAIDARTKQRGKQLEEIGFIFNEQKTENFWNNLFLDFEVWESMVEGLSDDDWTSYFAEVKKSVEDIKKKNKAHQERQKALKMDKQRMIEFVSSLPESLTTDYEFENEESKQLFSEIQGQLELFVKTKIETINKF